MKPAKEGEATGRRFAAVITAAPSCMQRRCPMRSAMKPVGISSRQNAT